MLLNYTADFASIRTKQLSLNKEVKIENKWTFENQYQHRNLDYEAVIDSNVRSM